MTRTEIALGLGLALLVDVGLAAPLPQQRVRAQGAAVVGIAVGGPGVAEVRGDGDAPPLVLPESNDLNRVLRKVTDFFAQDPAKWDEGVRMLQDLLDGRLLAADGPDHINDPFYSVFSEDQRLYIPFARYCQHLLCRLPPEGLQAYRFLCDGRAREAFERAAADLDAEELTRLAELYFATSSGPDIVSLLADLSTLRGELARAVYLRAWLLNGYPDLGDELRRRLLLRQAHAHALLGDATARDATFQALQAAGPDRTYDVAGYPHAAIDLPEHPAFRIRSAAYGGFTSPTDQPASPGLTGLELQRLWVLAFTQPDPYELVSRSKDQNRNVIFGSDRGWEMPRRRDFRPGFGATDFSLGGRRFVAVKDHDNLVVLDPVSGKVLTKDLGTGSSYQPNRGGNALRERIPATDFGLQRVHFADGTLYCTVANKPPRQGGGDDFPFRNRILAVDAATLETVWMTEDATKGYVFFETPPIAYRDHLYAPVRKKQSFCVAQMERATGKIVDVVTIHGGGTSLLRVPAVPPVRAGNVLVQLTNAGAVAAFSLPNLELRWLRAYEKRTPRQPQPEVQRSSRRTSFGSYGVQERALKQWKPSEPIVFEGRVILAPIDSDSLLCLDVNSGQPVWMLPRNDADRGIEFQEVVGHDDTSLYLAGSHLQCVDMASGKRRWERSLDLVPGGASEGYGCVVGGEVYLPCTGGVYRFRTADGQPDGMASFPATAGGEPNWGVPVRLQVADAVLLAVTESGVTGYTVPADLIAAAGDDWDRTQRLTAAGRLEEAWEILLKLAAGPGLSAPGQLAFFARLAGEVAIGRKTASGVAAGCSVLDRAEAVFRAAEQEPDPRLTLFRIECLDATQDAKEIRALREQLADLSLRQLGVELRPSDGEGGREK